MKTINFTLKNGRCPEKIGTLLHFEIGTPCVAVYDKDICVGVVWMNNNKAYGQAEIRFFDRYRDSYGMWHRMFDDNKQRIMYAQLQSELERSGEYNYCGKIK